MGRVSFIVKQGLIYRAWNFAIKALLRACFFIFQLSLRLTVILIIFSLFIMNAEKVCFPCGVISFLTDIEFVSFAKAVYIQRQGDVIIWSVIQRTAYFGA